MITVVPRIFSLPYHSVTLLYCSIQSMRAIVLNTALSYILKRFELVSYFRHINKDFALQFPIEALVYYFTQKLCHLVLYRVVGLLFSVKVFISPACKGDLPSSVHNFQFILSLLKYYS